MKDITFFAKTNFRNQETKFGIKTDDRRRHMYIIGKTGMGKTNLLEHMVIQDIKNGHGVAYVDPHGDTAEKIIKAIPSNRINDVIYFNPADQDFPIAFNVMEKVDPEYRHLVASGLVGVFKKIWADSWGPRLEYILRNAILGLLEYPSSTLLGVTRILVDKRYRERVVEKMTDPVVRSFWVDEFSKWNERVLQEVISPIQNKVGQFLSSSLIRNIVGQTKSSFDVREIMDNRKILILNLSKGRIGEDNSALLGAMMITKIQLAAMARVDIPEEERKDFYLYVDEFQNFATESFANILSEARKYRLNLVLANQYITQLQEEVRDAIFGNAGTLITFRVGAVDAEFMEKEFEPIFMMNDLVNLRKYNVYLKLMIDGIAGDAFSATTLPPMDIADTENNAQKVIKVSRERYASSRAEVEDKIARWTGMLPSETEEKIKIIANQQLGQKVIKTESQPPLKTNNPPAVQAVKRLFDAVCDTCGIKVQVPFEPDGKRPTFCKDCLKDYQRIMARAKTPPAGGPSASTPSLPVERQTEKKKGEEEADFEDIHKKVELKAYVPQESPMKLSQLPHFAPKKFESRRKRPEVNLEEVRKLIRENKDEENNL
jgi:CxxC-x17-CxxC domain-containing protein